MQISVELTLTPLKNDFEPPIKAFNQKLRDSQFTVLENPLSTQIYGEYSTLMAFLTPAIESVFNQEEAVVLQMKLIKGDRSNYVPSF
ncbi:MAG: hypothetical protein ACON47_09690 [Flavobacteriaceae bacterium]